MGDTHMSDRRLRPVHRAERNTFAVSEEHTYPFRYRDVNVQWVTHANVFINWHVLHNGESKGPTSIELTHAEARRVRDALNAYLEDTP